MDITLEVESTLKYTDDKYKKRNMSEEKYTNRLINETSPYLKQHAHNPVDWYPWGDEAFSQAKKGNKLVIISIGYSACHWCHVMEKETFSHPKTAELMNSSFISIKVDREERPDIDSIYMNAAQLISGQGGWPLNIIALSDGRPFYAGTYFPRQTWISLLTQITNLYKTQPKKIEEQAQAVQQGISKLEELNIKPIESGSASLKEIVLSASENILQQMDFSQGGTKGRPKFPMPDLLSFLLHSSICNQIPNTEKAAEIVHLTLKQMAGGGIYDQVGGGFARYSVDGQWRVPHFEKMLYDNAQLLSLYSEAFLHRNNPFFKNVVYRTVSFLKEELLSPENLFYSSLDADSEGQEGKFYVWKEQEIDQVLEDKSFFFKEYFSITPEGNWEKGWNILYKSKPESKICNNYQISLQECRHRISAALDILKKARGKRVKPAVDTKKILSWNALAVKGLTDAYIAFRKDEFLSLATKVMKQLLQYGINKEGSLTRLLTGQNATSAFLDDYAFTIQALIGLYGAEFREEWLFRAREISAYVLQHFHDPESSLLFYTPDTDPPLITRQRQTADSVIPSSNAVMAHNLFLLGHYFQKDEWIERSSDMLNTMRGSMNSRLLYSSHWLQVLLKTVFPFWQVTVSGEAFQQKLSFMQKQYLPYTILSGSKGKGRLPMSQDKKSSHRTPIYLCRDKTCLEPFEDAEEVLEIIREGGV